MIRALATGSVAGLAIFTVLVWAFAKGCPLFDPILDRDTLHHI
ncbi:hypothetical protein [Mycolicibacterium fortuitum]